MIEALKAGLVEKASPERVVENLRALGITADESALSLVACRLSRFITSTPDRIRRLIGAAAHPQHGRAIAFGLAQVLQYALDEDDLVSEASCGAVGFLDDAYLVHRFMTDVCQAYPAVRELAGGVDDNETQALVGRVLPAGVAAALDRTSERLVLVGASLFAVASASSVSPPSEATIPAFRLEGLLG